MTWTISEKNGVSVCGHIFGGNPYWKRYPSDQIPDDVQRALDVQPTAEISTTVDELRAFAYRRGLARICGHVVQLVHVDAYCAHVSPGALVMRVVPDPSSNDVLTIRDDTGVTIFCGWDITDCSDIRITDWEHREDGCTGFGPLPVAMWFDENGYGPSPFEISILGIKGRREGSIRLVRMEFPDFPIEGCGGLDADQLRALIHQAKQALAWLEGGQ
jgi:hypothetical protein